MKTGVTAIFAALALSGCVVGTVIDTTATVVGGAVDATVGVAGAVVDTVTGDDD